MTVLDGLGGTSGTGVKGGFRVPDWDYRPRSTSPVSIHFTTRLRVTSQCRARVGCLTGDQDCSNRGRLSTLDTFPSLHKSGGKEGGYPWCLSTLGSKTCG